MTTHLHPVDVSGMGERVLQPSFGEGAPVFRIAAATSTLIAGPFAIVLDLWFGAPLMLQLWSVLCPVTSVLCAPWLLRLIVARGVFGRSRLELQQKTTGVDVRLVLRSRLPMTGTIRMRVVVDHWGVVPDPEAWPPLDGLTLQTEVVCERELRDQAHLRREVETSMEFRALVLPTENLGDAMPKGTARTGRTVRLEATLRAWVDVSASFVLER